MPHFRRKIVILKSDINIPGVQLSCWKVPQELKQLRVNSMKSMKIYSKGKWSKQDRL